MAKVAAAGDAAAVKALASLPSRDELLAKLLGTMQAPVATFVRTLNEVPGRFVRTLAAIEKQKTEAEPAVAAEPAEESA